MAQLPIMYTEDGAQIPITSKDQFTAWELIRLSGTPAESKGKPVAGWSDRALVNALRALASAPERDPERPVHVGRSTYVARILDWMNNELIYDTNVTKKRGTARAWVMTVPRSGSRHPVGSGGSRRGF